jgi:histone acetyltransferase (RNA polymerase elongator complex component)
MRPLIIPFFLNQQGCRGACVYCDQAGAGARPATPVTPATVTAALKAALAGRKDEPGRRREAAFFGGTFTRLPQGRQAGLLAAAAAFKGPGGLTGVRLSTRPDALEQPDVDRLAAAGAETVEIGAQSFDEAVLKACRRGYTPVKAREAARRVKAAGMRLGLQFLVGAPGETPESRRVNIEQGLSLAPDDVRLYPLLVLKGAPLAAAYHRGEFTPLSLSEAVEACADLTEAFEAGGAAVIRLGLSANDELSRNVIAGPRHPAFGHLVRSRLYGRALEKALAADPPAGPKVAVQVAARELSQAQGHGKSNLAFLAARFGLDRVLAQQDPALAPGTFRWQGRVRRLAELAAE